MQKQQQQYAQSFQRTFRNQPSKRESASEQQVGASELSSFYEGVKI